MPDNTIRFSNRVDDYIKYRPGYPEALIDTLEEVMKISNGTIVADIGSGTGLSSKPFLQKDYFVLGVEPNSEMRRASEKLLASFPHFKTINGTAENTKLKNKSVGLIFCGQAFHWFDINKCKIEFERILEDNGNIVLAWNERSTGSAFQKEYDNILYNNIEEYKKVNHRHVNKEVIATFFSPKKMHQTSLGNKQEFNLQGLKGLLLSSSYCPKEGPVFQNLMKEMEQLFVRHQQNNLIEFEYETKIYWC